MQSLNWYIRRLQSMSPAEVGWRAKSGLRDIIDRIRIPLGVCLPGNAGAAIEDRRFAPGFSVSDVEPGEWASLPPDRIESRWLERLRDRAEKILRNRLGLFHPQDCDLGDPIDWNRDHEFGIRPPMRIASSIDYRNFRVTGDAKNVWEPNRHHHLVVLGRACRASGDCRYAEAVIGHIDSWVRQCPFGMGMNWRSPLELAIRLINWVWAIDLIRDTGLLTREFLKRLRHVAYLHLWEIRRKYSRGSSANNHLIGEAAGVFIGASYFPEFPNAPRWGEESRAILAHEITAQTYADGFSREHAFGYHLFILQFFLLAGIVARKTGADFPQEYWARLEKMTEFAGAMMEGGGTPGMNGDCDDGYVLDLGSGPGDVAAVMSTGAVLYGRPDFKSLSGDFSEQTLWLLGRGSRESYDAIETINIDGTLKSRAFPESGYYLLQAGKRGTRDAVSVVFDCAELGFQSIAAHGHADALSFTMRAFGVYIFVDPGTYDYFSFLPWRDYFRSTRAHNTVMIDGCDQSVMLGPFLWGKRARSHCTKWEVRENGGSVTGEHDGYSRMADPVLHRRTLDLDGVTKGLTIRDEIFGKDSHDMEIRFHLSEDCKLSGERGSLYEIATRNGNVFLELDPQLSVKAIRGSEDPIVGWVSRGYHHKTPCVTIIGSGKCEGNSRFTSRIYYGMENTRKV